MAPPKIAPNRNRQDAHEDEHKKNRQDLGPAALFSRCAITLCSASSRTGRVKVDHNSFFNSLVSVHLFCYLRIAQRFSEMRLPLCPTNTSKFFHILNPC